jgi:hypothetical protein
LKALADPGEIDKLLPADSSDSETTLSEFTRAGIDGGGPAAQFQNDGTKSFAKSCNKLMRVLAAKSARLAKSE